MKIFFLENDSFYKIFKTFEKLPQHKKVTCFIEEKNPIFDNIRRGKQIHQLLEKRHIQATRIAKSERAKKFYKQTNLTYEYKYHNNIQRTLHMTYVFLFEKKKFHQAYLNSSNTLKNLIKAIEIGAILGLMYLIYTIILPSATITITPNYNLQDVVYNFRFYPHTTDIFYRQSDRLSIPYHQGTIEHIITLKQSVKNISNAQTNAQGKITLYNTTNVPYDIVANTTFITESGLLFQSPAPFSIPPRININTPGELTIELVAKDTDIENNIMGDKGNIPSNTKLYIKNLKSSYFLKQIYATANDDFSGGETLASGSVTQEDIDTLEQKLQEQANQRIKEIVRQNFTIPNTVLLYIDELFGIHRTTFSTKNTIDQKTGTIEGSLLVTYHFPYVYRTDLIEQFKHYITERTSDTEKLIDINIKSLTLYDPKKTTNTENTEKEFIIPSEITTIQTYNFHTDPKHILPKLKENILGKSTQEATAIAQKLQEINTIDIHINPLWLKQITTTKSRISFDIK